MKLRWCVLGLVLIACVAGVASLAPGARAAEEGFTPLFNGKDLTGWKGDPRLWKVADGAIVGSTDGVKIEKNTFLFYEPKQFTDFVLKAKVKLRNHNSGIQFRSEMRPDFVAAGYQADIAEQTYFGMLYEEQKRGIMDYWKAMSPEKQAETQTWVKQGDWNEYEITCQGPHIKMVLNGHVTCEIDDLAGARKGYIALQLHTGPDMMVSFKDIEIKELTSKEARIRPGELMPDVDAARSEKLGVEGAQFRMPEGFSVEEVASHELIGSVINMTFDHLGRPLVATESEGVRLLLDENGDGKYDKVKSVSEVVKRAMGLCYLAPGDLLVQSDGPHAPGVYRLIDKNGDDVADEVTQVIKAKSGGMGEHSPHAIAWGADGFLYVMYGNHSYPDFEIAKDSPSRGLQEDFLMPRYWDARGHAKGILAPGGTIHRVSPDLKTMAQFCGGFRNAFDFAVDNTGEIFTFDSDMEWDIGTPWFRPVRVVHCVPGADYGWRSGSGKMPNYYFDTLPPLDDVGRGSPVGTCIYDHTVYPEKYRGGFYMGDWSRGRIRAMFPKQRGGSFIGKTVDFLVGEPLNVTDVDVGPDGLMYFTIGGRGTRGGLYRIKYGDAVAKHEVPKSVEDVVRQPMRRSAWGRYALEQAKDSLGKKWESGLAGIARHKDAPVEQRIAALEALQAHGPKPSKSLLTKLANDDNADVRAFAVYLLGTYPLQSVKKALTAALDDADALVQRRACDSLVRAGLDTGAKLAKNDAIPVKLLTLLGSGDTSVRYAARTALERTPRGLWAPHVLATDSDQQPRALIEGLLALIHTQHSAADMDAVFEKIASSRAHLSEDDLLASLRVIQLAFIRDAQGTDRSAFNQHVGANLLAAFPAENLSINRELQILLAHMELPGVIDKLLAYQTPDKSQEEQIHTAFCLRTIQSGWSREQRDRFVAWFDGAREMTGGASFEGFIEFIWQDALALLPEEEKQLAVARKDAQLAKRNADALALLAQMQAESEGKASELAQMSLQEIKEYLEYDPMAYAKNGEDRKHFNEVGSKVFVKSRCVNCHVFGTVGKGGGPDLSTVASRFRRADLIDAIAEPSKVISDQYIGLDVELNDLTTVTGMMVTEDENTLTLIDVTGKRVDIAKNDIESRKPATRSIMPEGLLNTMSLGELAALINYLERGAQ
ncbi:MAG: DUF1080 domain-containing protein [Candidatus Hydrogenedentes bacterium]|nr:DUF1080 domain-containing protein [Candidatus Hydrogenedentota bacterium]